MRNDFKRLIAFVATVAIVCSSVFAFKSEAKEAPLSLGNASDFSVFLQYDFVTSAADCEGNLLAGGSAYTPSSYDVGKDADRLAVIGGNNTGFLQVVKVMTPDEVSIDVNAEFANLRAVSQKIASFPVNGEVSKNPYNDEVYFKGDDEVVNVFTLTVSEWNELVGSDGNVCVYYEVPTSSTVIVNIKGTGLTNINVNYGCKWSYNGATQDVTNGSSNNSKILWNVPDTNEFGIGSSMGCLLAPDSKITSAANYAGCHFEGQVIAKSFDGNSEFGCTTFKGTLVPPTPEEPEEPTPEPTEPITPAPTDPVTPEPTEPITPAPTDPVTPEPTEPITPAPTDPVTPEPTEPITPAPTDPVTPEPTTPVTPAPTTPVTPEPTVPVTPAPTTPVTPKPTATVTPAPTTPVTPKPTATVTPAPTTPVTPKPTATVTPTPTTPVTPKPTVPVTPVPTTPITPKPTVPVTPVPTTPITPKPTVPVTPTPTAPITPKPTEPVTPTPTDPVTPTPEEPTPTPDEPTPTTPVTPVPEDPTPTPEEPTPTPTTPVTPTPTSTATPTPTKDVLGAGRHRDDGSTTNYGPTVATGESIVSTTAVIAIALFVLSGLVFISRVAKREE